MHIREIPFRRRDNRGSGGRGGRGSGGAKEPAWPWLGLAFCELTGDIAVSDTEMDALVLL